jgi:hypothetical protein
MTQCKTMAAVTEIYLIAVRGEFRGKLHLEKVLKAFKVPVLVATETSARLEITAETAAMLKERLPGCHIERELSRKAEDHY